MALEQLDELYRDVILDHFKNSSHSGTLPDAEITGEGDNPLCGDELTFHLKLAGAGGQDEQVAQVRFQGKGCAISLAAASMMAQQLEGKTLGEIRRVIDTMKSLMQGHEPDPSVDLGDLEALAGVRKFPVRVKCAALSWNVIEQGMSRYQENGRTEESSHGGQ